MTKEEKRKHAEQVFFQQKGDQPWSDLPYWNGSIDWKGCGLCSLTMAIDIVTGRDLTPADVYRMRQEAGIDQLHTVTRDGTSVCGGDAQEQFNEVYARLFGIRSQGIERSVEAFRDALAEDAAIWASSRWTFFYSNTRLVRYADIGHVVCVWKYEDGCFFVKDPSLSRAESNNVRYTEEQMREWLAARSFQQYKITAIR